MPVDKLSRMDALNTPDQQTSWDEAVKRAQGETGGGQANDGQVFKPVMFTVDDANWRDQANNALDSSRSTRGAEELSEGSAFKELNGGWSDLFSDLRPEQRDAAIREAHRPFAAVDTIWRQVQSQGNMFDAFGFDQNGLVFYKDGNMVAGPELSDDQKLIYKWMANDDALKKDLGGEDGIVLTVELKEWGLDKFDALKNAGHDFESWLKQNPYASREERASKRVELLEDIGPSFAPRDAVSSALNPNAPEGIGPAMEKYIKKHGNADPMSKEVVGNADYILNNWDQIAHGKDNITVDDLKAYLNDHPEITQDGKDAINFWTNSGMFSQLDHGGDNPALSKDDGIIMKHNIERWIDIEAPSNASQFSSLLNDAAFRGIRDKVDISGLGPDIFANPGNYTQEQRAAVLVELMNARTMIHAGIQSGLWSDYPSQMRVEHIADVNPDNSKVLGDLDDKINKLMNSDGIQDYMRDATGNEIRNILNSDSSLKNQAQEYYESRIKNGADFNDLKNFKDSSGKEVGIPGALEAFINEAETISKGLGLDPPDLRDMINQSGQMPAVEQYFKDRIVTGADLSDMLPKVKDPNIAFMAFGEEIAKFSQVLDPALVESTRDQISKRFGEIANGALLDSVTIDDINGAYSKEDGTIDEEKLHEVLNIMADSNPELFVGPDGRTITTDQAVAMARQAFDSVRQGAKVTDALKKLSIIENLPDNAVQSGYGRGALHLISGLIMSAVTITRGVQYGAGAKTPADIAGIVTGSAITTGLMMEGGSKGYNAWRDHVGAPKVDWTGKVENAGKILGGSAGIVAGIFGIISGASDIRKGNSIVGGVNIAGGGLTLFAGGASVTEGIMTFFGIGSRLVLSGVGMVAGIAGGIAALFGFGAMVGLQYWADMQQQKTYDKFANNVHDMLGQWGITGGETKDGDFTYKDDYINWLEGSS